MDKHGWKISTRAQNPCSSVSIRGFDLFCRTPEQRAEKSEAAQIDATDVADLVKPPGIVRIVNFHVPADGEAWQRDGHERAVQHSITEARRLVLRKSERRGEREKPAEQNRDDQKSYNLAREPEQKIAADGFRFLRRFHFQASQDVFPRRFCQAECFCFARAASAASGSCPRTGGFCSPHFYKWPARE